MDFFRFIENPFDVFAHRGNALKCINSVVKTSENKYESKTESVTFRQDTTTMGIFFTKLFKKINKNKHRTLQVHKP